MMFGWALMILALRASVVAEDPPPMPTPYSCICTYTVGCGSFKSKQIGCPCEGEAP